MTRQRTLPAYWVLAALLGVMVGCGERSSDTPVPEAVREALVGAVVVDRVAHTFPDLDGVTIPPNLCPVNFVVEEPGGRYIGRLAAPGGVPIEVMSDTSAIVWPSADWRRLVEANRGRRLTLQIAVEGADGRWQRFSDASVTVSSDAVDRYLVYRTVGKANQAFKTIGVHQRDLEGYDEIRLLHSEALGRGCMNCHTFANRDPSTMVMHVRAKPSGGMMLIRDGKISRVDTRSRFNPTPAKYVSMHPNSKLVAFAESKLVLFEHSIGQGDDVFDAKSDLGLYLFDTNTVTTTPAICTKERQETFPWWSPDGRHLYFSSAPVLPPKRWKEVRYDLMRIGYNAETNTWGTLETVLSADETGKSITRPRVSPDGKFLLFCMSAYGSFPVWQKDADLYMMDLGSGKRWSAEVNSSETESWHSWSSNGRWVVFSSRRRDGVLTKLYLSHVDKKGRMSKPFVLPQKDPTFYGRFLYMFSLPEFAAKPVPFTEQQMVDTLKSSKAIEAGLDPKVPPRVSAKELSREPATTPEIE